MFDLHAMVKEMTETHEKPRILVHEHGSNPSFADFLPGLVELNKTVTSSGKGCRVSIFTVFRDPMDRVISEMHWHNQFQKKRKTSRGIRAYADEAQDLMIKFMLVRK
jgi:hypothetical protein